jgi:hypothetical protein
MALPLIFSLRPCSAQMLYGSLVGNVTDESHGAARGAEVTIRPFLLIAGESSDGDKSWPFLESAREVYALYGAHCILE